MNDMPDADVLLGLTVALGLGLLIGIERERNKGSGPGRAAAGMRSFTLVALMGSLASHLGTPAMVLAGLFVSAAALIAFLRSNRDDPGLTTEIALLLTYLLGVLAQTEAGLAAALGVLVAILLAGKSKLHRFAQTLLTPQEIHDGLLLLASALIVLPLLPTTAIDPWGVLEVRKLWAIVVLIMAIGAAGHVALRVFGPRIGLPVAGFVGGFVSSSATIAAMGQRAQSDPTRAVAAAAAGMASSVATTVLMAILLVSASLTLLRAVWPMLLAGTVTALVATVLLARRARTSTSDPSETSGRPFNPVDALIFAGLLATVLLASAVLKAWLGPQAIWLAAASAGLADVHAVTLSMGQLVATDQIG
ncbi:MAG: MgtC/SapB family protein, partial [Xanthomonadales bacterium]|nr:MgtC/SapB family protein [Xanthomonadales bacterium]